MLVISIESIVGHTLNDRIGKFLCYVNQGKLKVYPKLAEPHAPMTSLISQEKREGGELLGY